MTDALWDLEADRNSSDRRPAGQKLTGSLLSKVSIAVLATAALSFAIVLILTLNSSRSIVLSQFSDDAAAITELLAANVSGGVRWNKPDVVAQAYEATVSAEHSNVGALMVVDKSGQVISEHRSALFDDLKLRAQIDRFIEQAVEGSVSQMFGDHLLAVSPTGRNKENQPYGSNKASKR